MTPPSISGPVTDQPTTTPADPARPDPGSGIPGAPISGILARVEQAVDSFLYRAGERALDLLLPPHCVGCDQPVLRQDLLCGQCFSTITFIAAPVCDRCGVPFDSHEQATDQCRPCTLAPPAFRHGRAPFLYDDGIRRLILPFKHGDRPLLARALAPHMARAGARLLADRPLLVPVPLHRVRLMQRRYNQAALLARAVAGITGCPTGLDVLRRVRATPSLDDRSATERRTVLDGAFAIHQRRQAMIQGRSVVLVDDVMTSCATADACARTLMAAGAATVDVLVAARVPIHMRS